MGFNATCLLKLCLAASWWVLSSLNYSGAVLCTTRCYLSFGLELAVFKTGTFSPHKLVMLREKWCRLLAAPPWSNPPLENVIQDLPCNKKRLSWDINFVIKSGVLHFLQGFQCVL